MRTHCLAAFVFLFLLLVLAGCGGDQSSEPGGGADVPLRPLSAAELQPVLREYGAQGVIPEGLRIEFAREITESGNVGAVVAGQTRLRVEPEIAGVLRYSSTSSISFVPEEGFEPSHSYRFVLEAVEMAGGVTEAPTPNPWVRRFETPEFRLVRFSPVNVDYRRHLAEFNLVFSAPVSSSVMRAFVRLLVVGKGKAEVGLPRVRFVADRERNRVRVEISSPQIRPGRVLQLKLAAGLPMDGNPDRQASGAEFSSRLPTAPEVKIRNAYVSEASNGFFVEVICDDSAVEGDRWYWDRLQGESYEKLSRRCQLEEGDAEASIYFQPKVDFTVTPSGGGFRIFAPFERGQYRLRIAAGARTIDGGVVRSEFETPLTVPRRSPQIAFTESGRYLPRDSWGAVGVRHMNLSEATLTVRHVREENLVYWLSDEYGEQAEERNSDLILKKSLHFRGSVDRFSTTYVDMASLIPAKTRGLLELSVETEDARAVSRILLTDLQLVAKGSGATEERPWGRKIHVWALDSESLASRSGVKLQLIRRSGFVLDECSTAARGGCELAVPEDPVDPAPPFAILARRGKDLSYLRFEDLKAKVAQAKVSGEPYSAEGRYRAALYSERGVYRPGDTVHLAAILRDENNHAPNTGMPVLLKLLDARSRTFVSLPLELNAAGFVAADIELPSFAVTGHYDARLEVAERKVGEYSFQVEEFVPERMEVQVSAAEPEYLLESEIKTEIRARYLFGGVPANHRVELNCEIQPGTFSPARNSSFHYGVVPIGEAKPGSVPLGRVTGALDGEGRADLTCPQPREAAVFDGPGTLLARAAVFESGSGRTTVARASIPVHPAAHYIGLVSGAEKASAGEVLAVEGVVVDWNGQEVDVLDEVEVDFVRLESEYGWYFDSRANYWRNRSYLKPVGEQHLVLPVRDGRFRLELTPAKGATAYLVRARGGGAHTDLRIEGEGYRYHWGPAEDRLEHTPLPDTPRWLALQAPDLIRVGEDADVSFVAPYGGRALLTVETDRLLHEEWKDVEAGEVVWDFELDEFVSQVYATVLLIKDPHLDSDEAFFPDRAFGVRAIRVEPEEYLAQLSLSVPESVRSGSTLTVELDAQGIDSPAWVSVAAVDEGILSLTGFESPDPLETIFALKALGVETFETVGWTLPSAPGTPSSSAGGGAGGAGGRIQSIEPVALWSGLVDLPASGQVEIPFSLPSYRGALRIMAVAAGPKRMGSADARVTVRDPLVLQATLPRFMIDGDELQLPVQVTNLSGKKRKVTVSLEAEELALGLSAGGKGGSSVELLGETKRVLEIKEGDSGVAVFRVRASAPAGGIRLVATATSGELVSSESATIPILPPGPATRLTRRVELPEGSMDLAPLLEGWVPMSEKSTITLTSNPHADVLSHLGYLARYPFGCIEQTTSATRPLLVLQQVIEHIDPSLLEEASIEEMAQKGIDQILSMQTSQGGFAYWPGGTRPQAWSSAYATDLLLDAQRLEYAIPDGRLDQALAWIAARVDSLARDQGGRRRQSWNRDAEPYMHYVLSRAGRARRGRAEQLLREMDPLSDEKHREQRYLLQAALHLSGDRRYEKQLRALDTSPLSTKRSNDWSFYSDLRRRGLELSVFAELFGNDPAGEKLAEIVADGLRQKRGSSYYTTQELAWGITALGKRSAAGAATVQQATLTADGRELLPEAGAKPGALPRSWQLRRASEVDELLLEVERSPEGRLYLVVSSEGVRTVPLRGPGGKGLRVVRDYRTADGDSIDPSSGELVLGEMVFVHLKVKNLTGRRVQNLALVDRVPAGWEIENPRLGRGSALEWLNLRKLWEVDHMNLRDDRLEVFGALEAGESRELVYGVRAVTAGRFTIPAVHVEAMYDPEIWARGKRIGAIVTGPWK